MKKALLALVALMAIGLTSCIKEETEITPDKLDGVATVMGYVYDTNSNATSATVVLYYKDGKGWTRYAEMQTKGNGAFSFEIGAPKGGGKSVKLDARKNDGQSYYFGESTVGTAEAGNAVQLDVNLKLAAEY